MLAADELFSVRMPFLDCLKCGMISRVKKVTVSFEKNENKSAKFYRWCPPINTNLRFLGVSR